jgi:hypothetical protein
VRSKQRASSKGMPANMQVKEGSLEREIAWALVQKYGGRARQFVLVEPQRKSKDRESDAPRLRLVTEDALKLNVP